MTVMAAGLAWRFGMVNQVTASKSFRILMLDEAALKNSHDERCWNCSRRSAFR